jgi:hypothetical protein
MSLILATRRPMTKAVRQRDQLLRSSFRGQRPTAAFLVRAGLLVVWLQRNVSGFRSVLARGWHGDASRCELSADPARGQTAQRSAGGFVPDAYSCLRCDPALSVL